MSDAPVSDDSQAASADVPAARTRTPWGWLALVALAIAAVGGYLALTSGEGQVTTIRVSKHGMLPEGIVEAPDYFVNVVTREGKTLTTNGYDDVPIGNGLDFKLPEPTELEDLSYAELLDRDIVSHDMLDRVDVRGRLCRGQTYEFEFAGPPAPNRTLGYWLAAGGATLFVLMVILLVRAHAV